MKWQQKLAEKAYEHGFAMGKKFCQGAEKGITIFGRTSLLEDMTTVLYLLSAPRCFNAGYDRGYVNQDCGICYERPF